MTEVKTAGLVFICFSLLHGFVAALNCSSPTPEAFYSELEKELDARKLRRPVEKFSDTLNVYITVTVVGIFGVDEKAQSLTTLLWLSTEWKIAGLSWDEKECGTGRVSVPREKLWLPDVHVAEFMDEDKSPIAPYVYLFNSGYVYDDKPMRVISTCRLIIFTFPFDRQNCSLTFESYLHYAQDIKMIQSSTPAEVLDVSRHMLQTRGEWDLVDITIAHNTLEIHDGSYSRIKYYVILRRRPVLYVVNLLIPSCCLLTLDVFSFLLPPHSVDRGAFKMTLVLGYTVFLLMMNDLLPTTGEDTTPLMNDLVSISFVLMVFSLMETVVITNIHFSNTGSRPVPRWLSVVVLRYLALVVGLRPKKPNRITVSLHPPAAAPAVKASVAAARELQTISADTVKPPLDPIMEELRNMRKDLTAIRAQMDKQFNTDNALQEWHMVSKVIDRLLFGVYAIFVIVCIVTVICLWVLS